MKMQLNKVMALVFAASFSGAGSMPLANSTGFSTLIEERQNRDWSFILHQNARCTGAADEFTGVGSHGCDTNIRYGSAVAFQKTYMEPDCVVGFHSDANCNNLIDALDDTDETICRTPVQGGAIVAWDAVC